MPTYGSVLIPCWELPNKCAYPCSECLIRQNYVKGITGSVAHHWAYARKLEAEGHPRAKFLLEHAELHQEWVQNELNPSAERTASIKLKIQDLREAFDVERRRWKNLRVILFWRVYGSSD